jgi:hypothetical protein
MAMNSTISANPTRPSFLNATAQGKHEDDFDVEDHEQHGDDVVPDRDWTLGVLKTAGCRSRTALSLAR